MKQFLAHHKQQCVRVTFAGKEKGTRFVSNRSILPASFQRACRSSQLHRCAAVCASAIAYGNVIASRWAIS